MNSFTKEVKKELSEINNLAKKNQVGSELKGYFVTFYNELETLINNSECDKVLVKFGTESSFNIDRYGKLLKNVDIEEFDIFVQGNNFYITQEISVSKINDILSLDEKDEEEEKAFARGCFLGGGSSNDPKNSYHIEVVFDNLRYAEYLKNILLKYNIISNVIDRKDKYILYINHGNNMSDFLAFIGAGKAVLSFEEERIIKEIRNNVNRMVNLETANLQRTISSSVKQVDAINKIINTNNINLLSDKEKELAKLRLENPNASLTELGKMIEPNLSRSGVNHRLKKIEEIANNIEKKRKNK